MASAQSARTHCPQGHPYDEANTMVRGNGRRVCRTCARARYTPVPKVSLAERLEAGADHGPGCWLWKGSLNGDGYARYSDTAMHRLAYELAKGPIPAGLTVDHECHNADPTCKGGACIHRRCVNPSHLALKSIGENVMAGVGFGAVNARKTHCPQGHPYSQENTYVNPNSGYRLCRTCHRERALERYYRMRSAT